VPTFIIFDNKETSDMKFWTVVVNFTGKLVAKWVFCLFNVIYNSVNP